MIGDIFRFLSSPLNTARGRIVVALLILTGAASVIITPFAPTNAWVFPVQVLLALAFIVGTGFVYTPEGGRLRLLAASAPAVGAVILGLVVLQQYFWLLAGAALGWFIAALMLFRKQTPREVTQAIRHMRKGRYKEAVAEMDTIIKRDPDNPEHYRLRAMVFRLDNRFDRARRDYDKMLSLAPSGPMGDAVRAEAYDGLSEVHLQARRFDEAREAALQAHQLFPDNWVPLYNLGLIHDRLNEPQAVIDYTTKAFELRIPDERQRLLARLYLARAYRRQNDLDAAAQEVKRMEKLWSGLEGLEKLLADDQAAPLSAVLLDDVKTARALMIDELEVADL